MIGGIYPGSGYPGGGAEAAAEGEAGAVVRGFSASIFAVSTRAKGLVFRAAEQGVITGGTWGIRKRRRLGLPVVGNEEEELPPTPIVGRGTIFFDWRTEAEGVVFGQSLSEQLDEELALIAVAMAMAD